MKIGFIGAGNVAFSLSKWFNDKYHNVVGIYSKTLEHGKECALFSISEYYSSLNELVLACDTLFLSVNDDSIKDVVEKLIELKIKDKILIHNSGIHSSDIFNELNKNNYCYSIHPIYAFNDKYNSYKGLNDIYFTLEGNDKYKDELIKLFNNKVIVINKEDKEKYHLACSILSNMVCGLVNLSEDLFKSIGIDNKDIYMPLFLNNMNNIKDYGSVGALTGPIIRNDVKTVNKHINNLSGNDLLIYKYLGLRLVEMSTKRTNNDYKELKKILEEI